MYNFLVFVAIVILYFLVFKFNLKPFENRYTLDIKFGKKGSGKSTYLQKLAIQHHNKGWYVFTDRVNLNMPFMNCIESPKDFYKVSYPPNSVLLIDEAGLLWDNRNFKSFPPELTDWLRMQRHYKVKVIMFSQSYDVDKKLKDLSDHISINKKILFWIFERRYERIIRVIRFEPTQESGGQFKSDITDDYRLIDKIIPKITYLPNWVGIHNSYHLNEDGIQSSKYKFYGKGRG